MTSSTATEPLSPLQRGTVLLVVAAFLGMLLLPGPASLPPAAQRVAAVTVLMAGLWLTQAVPIAATSLIPLVAFPLLAIQPAGEVSRAYMSPSILLYLGGFIIALGIERWGMHRRIALQIVYWIGHSPRRVILGFMLATAALSMWISNTAATLLMLPIGLAMIASLKEACGPGDEEDSTPLTERDWSLLATALMLAIAYSSSIGGMLTLVGTPTNITFQENYAARFPQAPEVPAGRWMLIFIPMGIVFVVISWRVLTWRLPHAIQRRHVPAEFFSDSLSTLGPPTRGEWMMGILVLATIFLWIFRVPFQIGEEALLPGWGDLVESWLVRWGVPEATAAKYLHDSTVAIGMALLMFCLPVCRNEEGKVERLMDWELAETLPWGILLLIGGGFAIASAFESTGLSLWVGDQCAAAIQGSPPWILIGSVCMAITFLTEVTSNVATANVVLPILAATAVSVGIDPRMIMIPATVSTSCAFMLPIGTPPNAIVFSSGHVRVVDMVRYGVVLNLVGVVLVTVTAFVLMAPLMQIDMQTLPEWARPSGPVESSTTSPEAAAVTPLESLEQSWRDATDAERERFEKWIGEQSAR